MLKMKNIKKKITTAVLILFLPFVSILCCCITATAHEGMQIKAEVEKAAGSGCCPGETRKEESGNHQDCQCLKFAEALSASGFDFSSLTDSFAWFFGGGVSVACRASNYSQQFARHHILRDTAQIVKNDLPIYLQGPVLLI